MSNNLDQVYRRPPAQACPEERDLAEAMQLAISKPGCRFEMPWLEGKSEARYMLTVQTAEPETAPVWNLTTSDGKAITPICSLNSADPKKVRAFVLSRTREKTETRESNASPRNTHSNISSTSTSSLATSLRSTGNHESFSRIKNTGNFPQLGSYSPTLEEDLTQPHVQRITGQHLSKLGSTPKIPSGKVSGSVLIGDLLQKANLVTADQVGEALPLSKKTGLPIGRILIEAGAINESILRGAVLAQSLIRDGVLHVELAAQAVGAVGANGESLDSALKRLGWRSEYYQTANKLGNLLLEAGCLSKQQLSQALEVCFASGLPLGRVLVLRKVVPEVVAYAGLSAQVLLREGKIPRTEAVAAVKLASSMKTTIQGWLEHGGILTDGEPKVIRLGELLSLAGIVSELDLLSSVERGLLEEKPIGQVLIGAKVINESTLKRALDLQERVNKKEIGPFEAANLLSVVNPDDPTDVVTNNEERKDPQGLSQLLSLVGLSELDDPKALLQEVLIQKQNLAYKVVTQHEEVKHRLARELHDTIIADLLMLRRYLAGDRKLTNDQTIEIVDDVVRQLREICNDFAPRQLQEWGLEMTMQDLTERVKARTGIDCTFQRVGKLPNLPEPVQLHLFRIVQESINNIEKYASASKALIRIESNQTTLRLTISDNGKGFESDDKRETSLESGGMGMQSMRERIELVRCYYPTNMFVQSESGRGSSVIIELTIATK
jgi:signal transduction histidine kinase